MTTITIFLRECEINPAAHQLMQSLIEVVPTLSERGFEGLAEFIRLVREEPERARQLADG